MIILADPGDESLAEQVRESLSHGGWRQFSSQWTTVDEIAGRTTDLSPNEVFFVVGACLERLALTIVCLRSICSNPVVAVSHGGAVRQIVQLMRVGATDILDIDGAFD